MKNIPEIFASMVFNDTVKTHVLDISRDKGGRFEETIAWLEESKR